MNLASTRLFAVPVRLDATLTFGAGVSRDGSWGGGIPCGRNYDVGLDGRLVMISAPSTAGNQIAVVLNWFEELKQKPGVRK